MQHESQEDKTLFTRSLIKNISILSSLLLFGVVLMVIVNHYEKETLEAGESTSTAQILGS